MNNEQLESKIRELLKESNLFNFLLKAKQFESEYKKTDFYKETKINLLDILKYSKVWYFLDAETLVNKIQTIINNVNFENISQLIEDFGNMYAQENTETLSMINTLKDIVK